MPDSSSRCTATPVAGRPSAVSNTCVLRVDTGLHLVLESEYGDLSEVVGGLAALGLPCVAEPALELGQDLVARPAGRPDQEHVAEALLVRLVGLDQLLRGRARRHDAGLL